MKRPVLDVLKSLVGRCIEVIGETDNGIGIVTKDGVFIELIPNTGLRAWGLEGVKPVEKDADPRNTDTRIASLRLTDGRLVDIHILRH